MAFMHGAQDGQKFMGVFMLGVFLASGNGDAAQFTLPLWLMILCSLVMAVGTSVGGYRIIKAVGMDMVKLEKYQGFAADLAASACLLVSFFTGGIPVSTTHTKTTAIMGVGAAKPAFRRQMERRQGDGAHLGAHLPGLRAYRLPHGVAVHAAVLIESASV